MNDMMKPYFFSLLILIFLSSAQAQVRYKAAIEYEQIVAALEYELVQGRTKALRDLGSLLDKTFVEHHIRNILRKGCMFSKEEFDLEQNFSKAAFLDFYYENQDKIHYDNLLNAYVISSPDSYPEIDLGIKLEKLKHHRFEKTSRKIEIAVQTCDNDALCTNFEQIKEITSENQFEFFTHLLGSKALREAPQEIQSLTFDGIAKILRSSQMEKAIWILIDMIAQKQITEKAGRNYLADLTNIHPGNLPPSELGKNYTWLLDSLGSFEALRYHGYQMLFDFHPDYFSNEVDYLGRILCEASSYPWIMHNVMLDMKKIAHPRAIYYVAAQVYKHRPHWKRNPAIDLSAFTEWIEDITLISLDIPKEKNSEAFFKTYFTFWAQNYQAYIWDEHYLKFVHKEEAAERQKSYDKLFRRLNSRNDSVAISAYQELAKGDAPEVKRLMVKYKQLLRRPNSRLPEMKYNFLGILSELSTYCYENDIPFEADEQLVARFDLLQEEHDDKTRFQLENEIIASLEIQDITALEFRSLVFQKNKAANYSVSRILDYVYTLKMNEMLHNPQELGFFLKKAALFKKIGVKGACNRYLEKLNFKNPVLKNSVQKIQETETDEDILELAHLLLFESREIDFTAIPDFLRTPEKFTNEQIEALDAPSRKDLQQIYDRLTVSETTEEIKAFFNYLTVNANTGFAPFLFKLLHQKNFEAFSKKKQIIISSHAISLLEKTYGHIFQKGKDKEKLTAWKKKWLLEKASFREWGITFYKASKMRLTELQSAKASDLNYFVTSPFFDEKDLTLCLETLNKFSDIRQLSRVKMYQQFTPEKHLKYFQEFSLPARVLDDVPQLFDMETGQAMMLDFLMAKSKDFDVEERGALFNKIMNSLWFFYHIRELDAPNDVTQKIHNILEAYLEEAEYMTEPEEHATVANIYKLKFIGKPLDGQLEILKNTNLEPAIKDEITASIVAGLSYEQIGEMVTFLYESPNPEPKDFLFLKQDFGIPVDNFNNRQALEDFIHRHKTMKPAAFYRHYLEAFDLDFTTKGKLDYNKIYTILETDHVIPFAGNGGRRDVYNYGLVKLLEYHFGTQLGFHEKLNEGQHFFSFTSRKRSLAWQEFLKNRGLIKQEKGKVPSFNKEIAYN